MSHYGCFCPECDWSTTATFDSAAREACLTHQIRAGHAARYGRYDDVRERL
jgi:hypothetical protein